MESNTRSASANAEVCGVRAIVGTSRSSRGCRGLLRRLSCGALFCNRDPSGCACAVGAAELQRLTCETLDQLCSVVQDRAPDLGNPVNQISAHRQTHVRKSSLAEFFACATASALC